jgi:glucose-6-phosphate 1-dehydrogenase
LVAGPRSTVPKEAIGDGDHPPVTQRPQAADVLVVFGISGDLAKVMTFRSLYRLERRGLLTCPVVGVAVDDWTTDDLRQYAHKAIEATREPVDERVFDRFAGRLSDLSGDFRDPSTFERVGAAIRDAQRPVFYLEIPPFLFGPVIKGLAYAGLTRAARVEVEKPFGHDLASARALNDPVGALRDVVVNHLMQVMAATAMEAPAGGSPVSLKDGIVGVFRAMPDADPAHYVHGQHDGYQAVQGVAAGSTTETFAALRLEVDNSRWSGVPFFIRTGKCLPVTQTELRLGLQATAAAGLLVEEPPATGALRGAAPRRHGRRQHPLHPPGRRGGGLAGAPAAAGRPTSRPPLRQGSWGPDEANRLVDGHGRWHDAWVAS